MWTQKNVLRMLLLCLLTLCFESIKKYIYILVYSCAIYFLLLLNPAKQKKIFFFSFLTIKQKMNIKDWKSAACDPFCSETWWFQQVNAPSQRRWWEGCGIPWFQSERKQGRVGGAKQMMMPNTHKDKPKSKTEDKSENYSTAETNLNQYCQC